MRHLKNNKKSSFDVMTGEAHAVLLIFVSKAMGKIKYMNYFDWKFFVLY